MTIESGAGADTVIGGPGAETIAAGDDADFVQPGGGDDTVLLGNGDDTALQGEGFDQVDGRPGKDTLRAVGTDESEEFTLQANGAKARIALDTRPSTTDSARVEALDVTAAGGPDLVDLGALDGTAVRDVTADLGFLDGARDQIDVQGTDQFDYIRCARSTTRARRGPRPHVTIENAVAADDRLTVFGARRRRLRHRRPHRRARIALTLDGGAGEDSSTAPTPPTCCSAARTGLDRRPQGQRRHRPAATATTRFTRAPADGHDRIEGGAGRPPQRGRHRGDDFIEVQGLLARTRLLYGFTGSADMGGVEQISTNPFGGTDYVTVRDLSGTATTKVDVRMGSADLRVTP